MEREMNIEEISDGKRYGVNDLVRVGCDDCAGCSACCRGMADTIVLDPFDIYQLTCGLNKNFEELLDEAYVLKMTDGLALPHLRFWEKEDRCVFLDEEERCSIHKIRPGICRLFPLGRIYEGRSFWYFLQVYECPKKNKTKVKVRKWLDLPEISKYEAFVSRWHYFLKDMQELASAPGKEDIRKKLILLILRMFYQMPYDGSCSFYEQFEARLQQIGILLKQIK